MHANLEKPKGRRASGEVREALIAHATAIIEEEGASELNLRSLASRVGVSQPALYRHFESKEALLLEVALRGTEAFGVQITGLLMKEPDPYGVITVYGKEYVRFAANHRGWFRLCFGRELSEVQQPPDAPHFLEARSLLLQALACIVPPEDPAFGHTFRGIWALAHGLSGLVIEKVFRLVKDDEGRLAAADAAIDEHVRNLRARWGEARPWSGHEAPQVNLTRGLPGGLPS